MNRTWIPFLAAVGLTLLLTGGLGGCASGGGGEEAASSEAEADSATAPPPGSPLSKVETGMSDSKVRSLLGDPDDARGYITGKAWIPFYFGGDTMRTDWMYSGQGKVIFSRNRWSGALKVIEVHYDPNQP